MTCKTARKPQVVVPLLTFVVWLSLASANAGADSASGSTGHPGEAEQGMSVEDGKVRDQLSTRGDDGKTPRSVFFYFYNGDLNRLRALAKANGFEVRAANTSPGLVLEKTLAVDEPSFAPVAAMMARWAAETGAEYDGWECAVIARH
jgi:hypothetical protein